MLMCDAQAVKYTHIYIYIHENFTTFLSLILLDVTQFLLLQTGPSCSELTMSLFNDSFKFQMAILQIQNLLFFVEKNVKIFCIANDSHILSTKITVYLFI